MPSQPLVRSLPQDRHGITEVQLHGKMHLFSIPTIDKFLARCTVTEHSRQVGSHGGKGGHAASASGGPNTPGARRDNPHTD
jgi:hypothetical protein